LNFFLGSNKTAFEDPFATIPEIWRDASSSSDKGLIRAHIVVSVTSFESARSGLLVQGMFFWFTSLDEQDTKVL